VQGGRVATGRVGARPIAEASGQDDAAEFGAGLTPYLAGLIAAVSLLYFYMGIRSSMPYGSGGLYTNTVDLSGSQADVRHGACSPVVLAGWNRSVGLRVDPPARGWATRRYRPSTTVR